VGAASWVRSGGDGTPVLQQCRAARSGAPHPPEQVHQRILLPCRRPLPGEVSRHEAVALVPAWGQAPATSLHHYCTLLHGTCHKAAQAAARLRREATLPAAAPAAAVKDRLPGERRLEGLEALEQQLPGSCRLPRRLRLRQPAARQHRAQRSSKGSHADAASGRRATHLKQMSK
jgi:hypothetical protein